MKYIVFGGLFALLIGLLAGCGKHPQRPELQGPPENPIDTVVLGRGLTVSDLKAIFKVLNARGEFNHLAGWIGDLSNTELQQWVDFANDWVLESALTPDGLVSLVRARNQAQGFSRLQHELKTTFGKSPELRAFLMESLSNPLFADLVGRSSALLDPKLSLRIKGLPGNPQLFLEFSRILRDPEKAEILKNVITQLAQAELVVPLAQSAQLLAQQKEESFFAGVAQALSEQTPALGRALRLAQLLNRPAERVVTVLQQGLQSNPDVIHALSMKWDPMLARVLSESVRKVLVAPEDGQKLDKAFWLSVPRSNPQEAPTPQFTRLYSIILSGIQKISDPRRLENQADSGSYRLPLQLNALFLTRFLEEVVRTHSHTISKLTPTTFDEKFWNLSITTKNFQLSLTEEPSKQQLSQQVRQDLETLGLTSVVARMENLLLQADSGNQIYLWEQTSPETPLAHAFSEAIGVAQAVKPMAEITPLLFTLVQNFSGASSGGLSLELLKKSPNLLEQLQSFVAALTPVQWNELKRLLFHELKIGQLEGEDIGLLVSLFQSDPEVAEWVGEVLTHLQSIPDLDSSSSAQVTLFQLYHQVIRQLDVSAIHHLSQGLSALSELGLLTLDETSGAPHFPAIFSVIQNGKGPAELLQGLSGLELAQARRLKEALFQLLLEKREEKMGVELLMQWLGENFAKGSELQVTQFAEALSQFSIEVTPAERLWLFHFVERKGFRTLMDLLPRGTKATDLDGVFGELTRLSQQGAITRAAVLLSNIRNERLREIALTLLSWDRSGELLAALKSVHMFFEKGEKP